MDEPRGHYAARKPSEGVSRLPKGSRKKRAYAAIYIDELLALHGHVDPAIILHLEMVRLSGMRWVQRREGWISLNQETLEAAGLTDRKTRHRAVKKLRAWGWLGVRGAPGSKLEYRLNPSWAKPKAEGVTWSRSGRDARR
jgi:hypothetical protein